MGILGQRVWMAVEYVTEWHGMEWNGVDRRRRGWKWKIGRMEEVIRITDEE